MRFALLPSFTPLDYFSCDPVAVLEAEGARTPNTFFETDETESLSSKSHIGSHGKGNYFSFTSELTASYSDCFSLFGKAGASDGGVEHQQKEVEGEERSIRLTHGAW